MTTFSQLIDEVATEMLRPDLRTSMASYVNQTIREMHFKPGIQVPVDFDANRVEDEVTVTTDGTWLWPVPSSTRFQKLEAAWNKDLGIYSRLKSPRVSLEFSNEPDYKVYHYRSGETYAFQGVAIDQILWLAYLMFPRTLAYKAAVDRAVRYDYDTDTYVLVAGGGVPTQAQMDAETNWMLQRWSETIKEGLRAKAYKRLGDEGRMRVSFSAFETMRAGVWMSEPST
jgi:hypothetical protein